jgi:pimeloyl-ACP methyl ester carboxylesterase
MRKFFKFIGYTLLALLSVVLVYCVLNYHADIPLAELQPKYTNAESEFMDLDDMKIHYRDEGSAQDSIPVVLIHGTSSFLQTWDAWTQTLSPTHRVIRLDLPGFALTGPTKSNDYSMPFYTKTLHNFLQKLKVNQCYLAGNSLGGAIAWEYVLAYPNEVKKLILIDAGGYPMKKIGEGNIGFKIAQIPVLRNIMSVVTPRSLVEKSLKGTYGDASKVTDELIQKYYDMVLREGNRDALVARFSTKKFKNEDYLKIKTITVPTLLIWGELDRLIPTENAQKFHEDLPNDTLIIYKGVGHVPMEEEPHKTGQDVMSFLKKK